MTTYDLTFEGQDGITRINATTKEAAGQKATRILGRTPLTITESNIDYQDAKEEAEREAVKYGSAYPKL